LILNILFLFFLPAKGADLQLDTKEPKNQGCKMKGIWNWELGIGILAKYGSPDDNRETKIRLFFTCSLTR
jgi:hypothetical protein